MVRKLGSPTLSRLGVWRDLEIQNRVTKYWTQTRTGGGDESVELGLVASMNLVELRLVVDICCRWTRIGVMEVDMWYMAAVMSMVVDGSGGGI